MSLDQILLFNLVILDLKISYRRKQVRNVHLPPSVRPVFGYDPPDVFDALLRQHGLKLQAQRDNNK